MSRRAPALAAVGLLLACAAAPRPVPDEERAAAWARARFDTGRGEARLPIGEGRVAVVVVFASWAEGARTLLPQLERLRGAEPGVAIAGVAIDADQRFVGPFLEEHGVEFPVLPDPGAREARRFGVRRVPTVVVFDPGGRISAVYEGASRATAHAVRRQVEALLR
jgi:thiol-disulfide isomerase/thioredoxin